MKRLLCLVLTVICFTISLSGCAKKINANDLIIKVDKNNLVEISEADILSYFEKNRESFKAISEYMLNNEKIFGTRPVLINEVNGIAQIQDDSIKKLANTLIQEKFIKGIASFNDTVKDVRFDIDSNNGVYQQGIRYVSDKKVVNEEKTEYNYVKEFKDLGNGWFYYIYYYNEIKDGDVFRKKAWDTLSEKEKKSIVYDWSKAIVQLKDVNIFDEKTGKIKKRSLVVSVTFRTNADGMLGPITIHFNPSTKEIVGCEPRL